MALNLHNNFILLYCAFPGNFPHWPSPANIFFFLWLEMVFKAMGLDVPGSYSVSLGLLHVYRRYTCYKTFVCFSTVNLSHGNLFLRPARRLLKGRGKFFLPNTWKCSTIVTTGTAVPVHTSGKAVLVQLAQASIFPISDCRNHSQPLNPCTW